jgi:hypothetical protein
LGGKKKRKDGQTCLYQVSIYTFNLIKFHGSNTQINTSGDIGGGSVSSVYHQTAQALPLMIAGAEVVIAGF